MELTREQLGKAETAIEQLSDVLDITEKGIFKILEQGIELVGSNPKYKYFLEEMRATFDCYDR